MRRDGAGAAGCGGGYSAESDSGAQGNVVDVHKHFLCVSGVADSVADMSEPQLTGLT
jgi:hypothetical protein